MAPVGGQVNYIRVKYRVTSLEELARVQAGGIM
jgi:hypothetical protein